MAFRFEKLDIWQQSLNYFYDVYFLASSLLPKELYNFANQLRKAAISISLNITEGSTGQTDKERSRFPDITLCFLIETIVCLNLFRKRNYRNIRDRKKQFKKCMRRLTIWRQKYTCQQDLRTQS